VFAKDTEPQGKERTEGANLAVICEFPSKRVAEVGSVSYLNYAALAALFLLA